MSNIPCTISAILFLLLLFRTVYGSLPVADVPSLGEEIIEFQKQLGSAIRLKDPAKHVGDLARITESIVDKALFLAIISSEMSNIVDGNVDLEQLKQHALEKFNELNSKLDAVLAKLDNIKNVVSGELAEFSFQEKAQQMVNIKETINAYLEVSNGINLVQSTEACEANKPNEIITYLLDGVTTAGEGTLISTIQNSRSVSKLVHYIEAIMHLVLETIQAHQLCFTLKSFANNQLQIDEFTKLYEYEKEKFKESIGKIETALKAESTNFISKTLEWAKQDVEVMMQAYPDMHQESFTDIVIKLLEQKYPHKKWVIVSMEKRGSSDYEYKFHQNREGFVLSDNYRNVAVFISTGVLHNYNRVNTALTYVKFGVQTPWEKKPCNDLFKDLIKADGGIDFACVQSNIPHSMRHSKDADISHTTLTMQWFLLDAGKYHLFRHSANCRKTYKNTDYRCVSYHVFLSKMNY